MDHNLIDAQVVRLREASSAEIVDLAFETATALDRAGVARVVPVAPGRWEVAGISKVGVIAIHDVVVAVEPKVPLERLFYLLSRGRGWGSWFEPPVGLGQIDTLYEAIAESFSAFAHRALSSGIHRNYVTERSTEAAIRGKWLVGEQLRARIGLPLPAELEVDEFTANIAENQIIRSASARLLRNDRIPGVIRSALKQITRQLSEVNYLVPGARIPEVVLDRRNIRYKGALELGKLVLTNGSLDHRVASTMASGFLLDLPKVFEDFVTAEVMEMAPQWGLGSGSQQRAHFDRDGRAVIQPDILLARRGEVVGVIDAKYKAEKPSGYPNADLYQMLAYCVRYGLRSGHLVYAAGNEAPSDYVITEAGITIRCHALALDRSPIEIAAQIRGIVAEVAGEAD